MWETKEFLLRVPLFNIKNKCHLIATYQCTLTFLQPKFANGYPFLVNFTNFFVKKSVKHCVSLLSICLFLYLKKGNWQENFSACVVTLITGQQPGRQGGLTESSFDKKIESP